MEMDEHQAKVARKSQEANFISTMQIQKEIKRNVNELCEEE